MTSRYTDYDKEPSIGDVRTDTQGRQLVIADHDALTGRLHAQFPDGVTIPLPAEDMAHLLDIQEAVSLGEEYMLDAVTFAGQIGSSDPHWVPSGTLSAELRLPPDMYGRIYPLEDAYPLDVDGAVWMSWEDRAATRLLHDHPDTLVGARVDVTIREDILPFLYIEGRPFFDVMNAIEKTGCVSEAELKQLLHLQNLHENGLPMDGKLPECLEPLLGHITEKYRSSGLSAEERKAYGIEVITHTGLLLKNAGALPADRHNLVATFRNGDGAARRTAETINRLYAPKTAFAVCQDNVVQASIDSHIPSVQTAVKKELLFHGGCINIEEKPFRDIGGRHTAYMLCHNGQVLKGYVGLEGVGCKNMYGVVPVEPGRGYSMLAAECDRQNPGRIFATDDTVTRFRNTFKGPCMPIAHMVMQPDFQKHLVFDSKEIAVPDRRSGVTGEVWLSGRIGGEAVIPKRLSEEDARILDRFEKFYMGGGDMNLVKSILFDAYYREEIERAWPKVRQSFDKAEEKTGVRNKLMDRITGAALYGRVDNIHVRCRIDGVQQIGRPITAEDAARYAVFREDAALLGRDTLNYRNYLHEDTIREIASHAFADVLSRDPSQDRVAGLRR